MPRLTNRIRAAIFVAAAVVGSASAADVELRVPVASAQLSAETSLGSVAVEGVGPIELFARREGLRLLLTARGPRGDVVGRAESTVGLDETPIAVRTPTGLETIRVLWSKDGAPQG